MDSLHERGHVLGDADEGAVVGERGAGGVEFASGVAVDRGRPVGEVAVATPDLEGGFGGPRGSGVVVSPHAAEALEQQGGGGEFGDHEVEVHVEGLFDDAGGHHHPVRSGTAAPEQADDFGFDLRAPGVREPGVQQPHPHAGVGVADAGVDALGGVDGRAHHRRAAAFVGDRADGVGGGGVDTAGVVGDGDVGGAGVRAADLRTSTGFDRAAGGGVPDPAGVGDRARLRGGVAGAGEVGGSELAGHVPGKRRRQQHHRHPHVTQPFEDAGEEGEHVDVAGVDLVDDDDLAGEGPLAYRVVPGGEPGGEKLVDGDDRVRGQHRAFPAVEPPQRVGVVGGVVAVGAVELGHGVGEGDCVVDGGAGACPHRVRGGLRG